MTILVSGGTGFVGSAVVPMLLDAGHSVRLLRRRPTAAADPRCTTFEGDALDVESVTVALAGCDAIVHLVGIKRQESSRTGRGYDDVDVESVRVALEAMRRCNVGRIILLSAAAIGNSAYVLSKGRAEALAMESGFAWTIFRPSFVLGPGQEWPRLIEPLLALVSLLPGYPGDIGKRSRAVTREELARCILWSLEHPASASSVIDVPGIRRIVETEPLRSKNMGPRN